MSGKIFLSLFIVVLSFSFTDCLVLADKSSPPKEGDKLPLIRFSTPETLEEKTYLGIDKEDFLIPDIKADFVIVYFFSFYCRFCAAQAVHLNELYSAIDKDPDLKNKIKFIGIGTGNTPMEVDAYKEANRIPFPLIPDTDFSVHKAYGEIMTPYFVVISIKEDGTHRVIYTTYAFDNSSNFLKLILKKADLTE